MKHGSVLLADSHQNMLEGIRGLLETMFESVVMVADETSLIQTVDKLTPDLIVVDLSLPTSQEVNVAHRLNKHNPDLKVIILSIHDEPTVVEKEMDAGVEGFVLNRSASTDLIPAVEEVLKGRTYISPSLGITESKISDQ